MGEGDNNEELIWEREVLGICNGERKEAKIKGSRLHRTFSPRAQRKGRKSVKGLRLFAQGVNSFCDVKTRTGEQG